MNVYTFILLLVLVLLVTRMTYEFLLRRDARRYDAEELRTIQEVYEGLLRLEERVQSLETILLDRRRQAGPEEYAGKGADL